MDIKIPTNKLTNIICKYIGDLDLVANPFNPYGEINYINKNGDVVFIVSNDGKSVEVSTDSISQIINSLGLSYKDIRALLPHVITNKIDITPEEVNLF